MKKYHTLYITCEVTGIMSKEQYDQFVTCESSKKNSIAGWEDDFCIIEEGVM
jgi:hypothetical protein